MNTLTDAQRERVLALLRQGKTLRRIEQETGHRRETIAAYGRRAGLLGGAVVELPTAREPISSCEPHRETIESLLRRGASLRAIHARLVDEAAFRGSYSALKRFVRSAGITRHSGAMMLAA